ncbi:acyl-CoA carboxylase epsilon subunit [Pedococcus sp. NPDC057267]|uniref:acyl-CoA carboxylase epsilon subunit n=1 Tax=Pedococcus sp. NPDC057267 TaxID=3346077 RepID=UPI0036377F94
MGDEPANGPERTPLRLVRGDATPEEVAALLAVLSAAAGADDPPPAPRPVSRWASRERAVRRPLAPGQGAWRASGWPR